MLDIKQLALRLGVKESLIRQLIFRREIPFCRVGKKLIRFDEAVINIWLQKQTVQTKGNKFYEKE